MIEKVDNFICLSIELEKQSNDPREKSYHALMREVFSIKASREAFIQAGIISKAQYFGNKIDNRIIDRMGQGKKGWLSRGSVATLRRVTTTKRVMDLLNIAENKGPELHSQIIVF